MKIMEDLIKKYGEGYSIEKLCSEFNLGKNKIKNILLENNITIRKKGGQQKNFKIDVNFDYDSYNVGCRKCYKIFSDPKNRSGALTEHIKECFPDIEIPSKFKRITYKNNNGKYWHMSFFNLIEKDDKEFKCPVCDWTTKDLTNKSGSFTKHVEKDHFGVEDFLLKNKEYTTYFNMTKKLTDREKLLIDDNVQCEICGEFMFQINNTHLKKHNLTVESYKLKFPDSKMVSNGTSQKLREQQILNNVNMTPTWTSKGEIEVVNFINGLGFKTEKGKNRKLLNGKEIDIIVEEKKLCIEYNGLYYHTENMGKYPSYHIDKTIDCNRVGYELIHIFEDEWVNRNEIVKSKLVHILGVNNKPKLGARKTKITHIDTKTKNEFLDKNHIQESDNSKICLGAYYGEILVGVMTFNDNRKMTKNNENEYELTRFATHLEYIISGLGAKMLKFFIDNYKPQSIISFADRRWTTTKKNIYLKLGFELVSVLPPDYKYYNSKVNKYRRYHKFNFGKTNLIKKYPNIDLNKSEREITNELGFDRIWDCGLLKYKHTNILK